MMSLLIIRILIGWDENLKVSFKEHFKLEKATKGKPANKGYKSAEGESTSWARYPKLVSTS